MLSLVYALEHLIIHFHHHHHLLHLCRGSTSSASGAGAGGAGSRRSTFTGGSKGSTAGVGRKTSTRHDRQTGHGTDDSLPDDDED